MGGKPTNLLSVRAIQPSSELCTNLSRMAAGMLTMNRHIFICKAIIRSEIIMDSYHRWFGKNCTITMTCALAPGCKEQILQWMSEGKFDTTKMPTETWPVEKCAEAYEYKQEKRAAMFSKFCLIGTTIELDTQKL